MSQHTTAPAPKRVLSGMRPTGRLHLGNYMGALKNWVELQNATNEDGTPKYECYFFIADYHALTTDYADTSELPANVHDVTLEFLAAGLDPKKSVIFIQSEVEAHFALSALLEMITPISWLERVPTYKDQQEQLREKDLATIGFLGYPLLQSADILVYQADFVPVGQDQAAHVEITREIARRFNFLYGVHEASTEFGYSEQIHEWGRELAEEINPSKKSLLRKDITNENAMEFAGVASGDRVILPEPKVLLTPSPKLPGTDGRKMSKSYKNTILLSDPEPDIRAKLKTMVTDPARIKRTDPGNPDICPVFDLHKVFSSTEIQAQAAEGCRTAGIGCIQCKGWLADAVVAELAPMQERRQYFESRPEEVSAILDDGAVRARDRAAKTMQDVRKAVRLARR
jgi:tryptophanyl-tRNA synthetase